MLAPTFYTKVSVRSCRCSFFPNHNLCAKYFGRSPESSGVCHCCGVTNRTATLMGGSFYFVRFGPLYEPPACGVLPPSSFHPL